MYQQCSATISLNTLTLSSDLFGGHEKNAFQNVNKHKLELKTHENLDFHGGKFHAPFFCL
jgi:hypothetical protein